MVGLAWMLDRARMVNRPGCEPILACFNVITGSWPNALEVQTTRDVNISAVESIIKTLNTGRFRHSRPKITYDDAICHLMPSLVFSCTYSQK